MSSGEQNTPVTDLVPMVNIFHVGGRGGNMGPVEHLFQLAQYMEFSIFEANIDDGDDNDWQSQISRHNPDNKIKVSIIPQCISNCVGKKTFHINAMPECSSFLKMSPEAEKFQRIHKLQAEDKGFRIEWGKTCQPVRSVELDVTTLDKLYEDNVTGLPDFLSVDARGAGYDVLEGASNALNGDLTGVVSKAEFHELYDGQKLFGDQCNLLEKHDFKLIELYDYEYWHQGLILGEGVLTAANALFLRDHNYFIEKYDQPAPLLVSLAKLAIVANCFERTSYTFEIIEYIMTNWRDEWEVLVAQANHRYLKHLVPFYEKGIVLRKKIEESRLDYVGHMKKVEQASAEKA